jgi:hypothetical protein
VREGKFSGGGTDAENGKEGVDYNLENSVRLIKAGVPHILSTDAGTIDPDVEKDPNGAWGGLGGKSSLIGEAEFIEMRAMHQRGMTPMMVIQASTQRRRGVPQARGVRHARARQERRPRRARRRPACRHRKHAQRLDRRKGRPDGGSRGATAHPRPHLCRGDESGPGAP